MPGATRRATEIACLSELAHQLLDSAPRRNGPDPIPVLTVERLRPALVLERIQPLFSEHPELRIPEVDALTRTHPELAETVLAWCGAFGNVAMTARRLGIHENTVRYRLQRAEEFLGRGLDDADTRLTTWLQLRVSEHAAEVS